LFKPNDTRIAKRQAKKTSASGVGEIGVHPAIV
jgi:hypothetical protein